MKGLNFMLYRRILKILLPKPPSDLWMIEKFKSSVPGQENAERVHDSLRCEAYTAVQAIMPSCVPSSQPELCVDGCTPVIINARELRHVS